MRPGPVEVMPRTCAFSAAADVSYRLRVGRGKTLPRAVVGLIAGIALVDVVSGT